jgi:hypothetical protein
MGGGTYNYSARLTRASSLGYDTKSVHEIFDQRTVNSAMNPHGVKLREARDSKEHPESLGVVIALDVTGSMGSVPHHLVKDGLPEIMDGIIKAGIADPQVLFMGVGDHECDRSPLQVGQFESSDDLLDKWLTTTYLEGGGGGNAGESYMLAWYFAAKHTALDCWEKRKKKGFLFTIGDEPVLRKLPKSAVQEIMGSASQPDDYTAAQLLEAAREAYEVYHIHIRETSAGSRNETIDDWKQLLGDHLLVAQHHDDVARIIRDLVAGNGKSVKAGKAKPEQAEPEQQVVL